MTHQCSGDPTVDDAVLKEIIRKLYYPDSPYEFSVIGADILGQVYEQFLGKVILNAQSPANTPHERAARARQIAATDHEIDQLVYELYGLTDDEIRIVEEATTADTR